MLSLLLLSSGLVGAEAAPGDQSDLVDEATPSNETVGGSDETTNGTGETLDETTNGTGETLDETTNGTGETLDDAIDEAEGTGNETTETIDGAVDETTTAVGDGTNSSAVGETTESLDDTAGGTTEELDGTVDWASDELDRTVPGTIRALRGTESQSTAEGGPEGAIPGAGTSRSETASSGPAPADESDDEHDGRQAGAAAGGGSPESGSSDGVTIAGLLVIGVLSSSVAGTANTLVSGAPLWPHAGRVALRVLRAGVNQPWKHVVLVLRFSRHDGSDPLEHEHRRTIYDAITDTPGVYLSELGERSDLSLSSVRHHLRVLNRENLIETEKVRGKRRFYPVETGETTRVAALSDPTVRRLLEALAALGEARNDRLADELDRSPSTVSHHLSSLEEDGLVVRERDGRATVNRLPPAVANSLGGAAADGGTAVERPRSAD